MTGLDPSVIERLRRLGGEQLVEKLIEIFQRDAPARLEEIRAALASGNLGPARRAAHSLISLAGNLGATRLQSLAALAEQAAEAADRDGLATLVEEIEEACGQARTHFGQR